MSELNRAYLFHCYRFTRLRIIFDVGIDLTILCQFMSE
jgi:hypothetical protein